MLPPWKCLWCCGSTAALNMRTIKSEEYRHSWASGRISSLRSACCIVQHCHPPPPVLLSTSPISSVSTQSGIHIYSQFIYLTVSSIYYLLSAMPPFARRPSSLKVAALRMDGIELKLMQYSIIRFWKFNLVCIDWAFSLLTLARCHSLTAREEWGPLWRNKLKAHYRHQTLGWKSLWWLIHVVVCFSASESFDSTYPTNVVVTSEGLCTYIPPGMFKSSCPIDITWFPFDDQNCEMKFGSWTYNGFKVELQWRCQRQRNFVVMFTCSQSLSAPSMKIFTTNKISNFWILLRNFVDKFSRYNELSTQSFHWWLMLLNRLL